MTSLIIDTSALIIIKYLGISSYFAIVFSEIFIPSSVEREFLNEDKSVSENFQFINELYEKFGFAKCNTYDFDQLKLIKDLERSLGDGEAEVIAQALALNKIDCIQVIDDRKAKNYATSMNISAVGSLLILAAVDKQLDLGMYWVWIEKLSRTKFRFKRNIAEEAKRKIDEGYFTNLNTGYR